MKTRIFTLLLIGCLLSTGVAFAANDFSDSPAAAEKRKLMQEAIAKNAAFVRQVNAESQLTPEQKKAKIDAFFKAQYDEKK
jgi:hypothetical protein